MEQKTYLITGGSGSLGTALTHHLLAQGHKVRTISRNEHRLQALEHSIPKEYSTNFSPFCGDVRDRYRLWRAFAGVDVVIHAAALKGVPRCEIDPQEAVKTNIDGTANVANAVLDCDVKKAVFISSDKAVAPTNLYGMTKAVGERLWLNSNKYCGAGPKRFIAVRWGNVFGSNGSVMHLWEEQFRKTGRIQITHEKMTRFHITMDGAIDFLMNALLLAEPGELWIPKLWSYSITALAAAFNHNAPRDVIGMRPSEKVHESLIGIDESIYAREATNRYVITPGVVQNDGSWAYTSGSNPNRFSVDQLKEIIGEWKKS